MFIKKSSKTLKEGKNGQKCIHEKNILFLTDSKVTAKSSVPTTKTSYFKHTWLSEQKKWVCFKRRVKPYRHTGSVLIGQQVTSWVSTTKEKEPSWGGEVAFHRPTASVKCVHLLCPDSPFNKRSFLRDRLCSDFRVVVFQSKGFATQLKNISKGALSTSAWVKTEADLDCAELDKTHSCRRIQKSLCEQQNSD